MTVLCWNLHEIVSERRDVKNIPRHQEFQDRLLYWCTDLYSIVLSFSQIVFVAGYNFVVNVMKILYLVLMIYFMHTCSLFSLN